MHARRAQEGAVRSARRKPVRHRLTWYSGSSNDLRLNLLVRRFSASPAALQALVDDETTGDPRVSKQSAQPTRRLDGEDRAACVLRL